MELYFPQDCQLYIQWHIHYKLLRKRSLIAYSPTVWRDPLATANRLPISYSVRSVLCCEIHLFQSELPHVENSHSILTLMSPQEEKWNINSIRDEMVTE